MSLERLIEEKIKAAMDRGEFDNLSGKGKPIDLDAYFATPEDMRVGHSVLKSAGFVPEEVQLLKEIESLRRRSDECRDEDEKARIKKRLDQEVLKLNLLVEKRRKRRGSQRF
ncbi:MAG TPA: DUF1992 domain-containing protein [Blastocatellia bacterium]|nr:DUF1992 domain-containing protein [Blastocatellia bacterium]